MVKHDAGRLGLYSLLICIRVALEAQILLICAGMALEEQILLIISSDRAEE